ncbi:unnamed protein product [Cylicocyclus nassatus]|uniref:Uncharacterized protein n=1 Tax=Cylicocyclus nassatus TaxID=53992 RepID=A0AA36GT07_CYLNA|nr:unnamed protein product [Cylicocyclus nassatus]
MQQIDFTYHITLSDKQRCINGKRLFWCFDDSTIFHGRKKKRMETVAKLPSSDLGSCRLTCRSLNSLIEGNWNALEPRYIGIVEFTPSGDVWCLRGSMRFYYKRKLEYFNNVAIFFLILLYGELTTPMIQSLTQTLTQSRISIRRIVICNTPCRCEVEHLLALIESAQTKSLIIDVCGRIDLGKKLSVEPLIQRLQTVFIYSYGSEASYYMAEPFFKYDAITLEELDGLMEVWHMGSIKLLHLHMPSYGDWTTDTKSVLKAVGKSFSGIRGNVLLNDEGQGFRVDVNDGRVTFAYVEKKRKHRSHV